MKIQCDGFEFDFTNAIDVFVFDEKDRGSPNYHGLSHSLKAVDLIVELDSEYAFVEVKDFFEPEKYRRSEPFKHLRDVLKYKYRDTWIYRWAENKIDKPIKYICLLELENALISRVGKEIRTQLPVNAKKYASRWESEITAGIGVVNLSMWNQRFTAWPATRIVAA